MAPTKSKKTKKELAPDAHEHVTIPIVVKTDVAGTLEAILAEIEKLGEATVSFNVLASGVGDITENDIQMAASGNNPIVVGFNVKIDKTAEELIRRSGITPHLFDVIYRIGEKLAEEVAKRRPRVVTTERVGRAKVIRLFNKTKHKQVVGAEVIEGIVPAGSKVSIMRNKNEIGKGAISEMQVEKEKVRNAEKGTKAGFTIASTTTIALGDELHVFDLVEK